MRFMCTLFLLPFLIFAEDKSSPARETAIFAGGCFWGIEYFMELEKGVVSVTSGYTGGDKRLPNYRDVSSGKTGHAEAVKVVFDPGVISYEQLARKFFRIHDPTEPPRETKTQYRSAIFYTKMSQKKTAEALIRELKSNGYSVETEVARASTFWRAEPGHQNYYNRIGVSPKCHKYLDRFKVKSRSD